LLLLSLLTLLSCRATSTGKGEDADVNGLDYVDDDGDGFFSDTDCNDSDASVNTGAAEICDGVDNNCDGDVDEGVTNTFYADEDGDGFGDADLPDEACSPMDDYVTNDGDCDDEDEQIFPGALEICDEKDNNCDSNIDEGVGETWYADADGDSWGDAFTSVEACSMPDGYVSDDNDCDDTTAEAFPGHAEICDEIDNDCNGEVDEGVGTTWYEDRDADDWGVPDSTTEACARPTGYAPEPGDCDDEDALYHPYADESDCTDPNDYNCDGSVGYADADTDGWPACLECDDLDANIRPDATEVCNGLDDDCDTLVDDADPGVDLSTGSLYYEDADADTFGDPDQTALSCEPSSGYVEDNTDCDDDDSHINPDASEVCNGLDDDCDTLVDDEDPSVDLSTGLTWYEDADGDGYGDALDTALTCDEPDGYTSLSTDCDDSDPDIKPGAAEICDGIDNDCDGLTDDDDGGVDLSSGSVWYRDLDGDGFGDLGTAIRSCEEPVGYVSNALDCDDGDVSVNPDAAEICDGLDNDCDTDVDDDDASIDLSTGLAWYSDADGDSYGDPGSVAWACAQPTGYVADYSDCNDGVTAIHPGASETCDGLDNDCDSAVDDADASVDLSTGTTWYADADGDTYGDASSPVAACAQPTGHVLDQTDCNDAVTAIHPGANEICDSLDNDCDSAIDDADPSLDLSSASPWYQDGDGDGHAGSTTTRACLMPAGASTTIDDCDDSDALVYPSAAERCNSADDDCDTIVDEGVLGSGTACTAESCLEVLNSGSSHGDGTYYVDFSGTSTAATCDMTTDGGGWTLIFHDDFQSTPAAGWSSSSRYSCGFWSIILGGYGKIAGGSLSINLSTYGITHSAAWVSLDYMALDSWDGETAYVQLDGSTVWSQSQNNHSGAYSEVCGWSRGYFGSFDSQHAITSKPAHTASTLTILAGSTLDQDPTDESFGIDDVYAWVR
jgi:hypothetical protein